MPHRSISTFAILGLTAAVTLTGCKTVHTESYAGRDSGQVWTAMKAVAESPGYYDDWFLTENFVAVYEEDQRIEIHRELRRDRAIPGSQPQREERAMDQTITLVIAAGENEEVDPIVKFVTAGPGIPARDEIEAELYFADVWELLGGRPEAVEDSGPDDAVEAETDDDEDAAEMIDIDDMDG